MKEAIELKATFHVKPSVIYQAWLNGEEHAKMTGGTAQCTDKVGDPFFAWDGYISGVNLMLIPNIKIVQSWRTSQFAEEDEDSRLVIQLAETDQGTDLTLIHTNIPEGQTQYKQGWIDHYFVPMKAYFE